MVLSLIREPRPRRLPPPSLPVRANQARNPEIRKSPIGAGFIRTRLPKRFDGPINRDQLMESFNRSAMSGN